LLIVSSEPFATVKAKTTLQTGMVSLTFDDGREGQRTLAADILKSCNLNGTAFDYITSLSQGPSFLSLTQLRELHDSYGWEIGDHTYSHPHLGSLNNGQLQREIVDSKNQFSRLGFNVETFAYPYSEGSENPTIAKLVKENYLGARSSGTSQAAYLYDETANIFNIVANNVANTTRPETVRTWVDQAISQKKWLILTFHEIVLDNPALDTFYTARDLQSIVAYVCQKVALGTLVTPTFKQGIETLTNTTTQNKWQSLLVNPLLLTSFFASAVFIGFVELLRKWRRSTVAQSKKAGYDRTQE